MGPAHSIAYTVGCSAEETRLIDWMAEPSRSCRRREIDQGARGWQAFLLAPDAACTDPVCRSLHVHCQIEATLRDASTLQLLFSCRHDEAIRG